MSSAESLRDTITPKSDQLNADDLIAGPITVRVEAVKRSASPDQPIDVMIAGHRPFRPCKSMRRVLIAIWGDQGSDWVGKSMTLYCDPAVKFGGVAVGGIRISHMTGIDKPVDLMLTTTRSKRSVYTVYPLDETPVDYPQADFEKNLDAWVGAVVSGKATIPQLLSKVSAKGVLTTAQRERLEAEVNARNSAAETAGKD